MLDCLKFINGIDPDQSISELARKYHQETLIGIPDEISSSQEVSKTTELNLQKLVKTAHVFQTWPLSLESLETAYMNNEIKGTFSRYFIGENESFIRDIQMNSF